MIDPATLTPSARAELQRWLTDPRFAPWREATEAAAARGDPAELEDAFGRALAFGTGGMRGACGPGPGRMNGWVVARATQGLADFLRTRRLPMRVVIGYDVRADSRSFAETAARVLAAAGVEVHFFDGLCSTPQLSFAVHRLECGAGIMITASHNPPTDNGYKCYQAAGRQFAPPDDDALVAHVEAAVPPDGAGGFPPPLVGGAGGGVRGGGPTSNAPAVEDRPPPSTILITRAPPPTPPTRGGEEPGRVRKVHRKIRAEYLAAAVRASRVVGLNPLTVRVLYTPFHGVGMTSVRIALRSAGFRVRTVESQSKPDARFPTLPAGVANPEEPATFHRALCAARDGDDLILATDPDADRIGVMVRKTAGGEWIWLDGHQLMVLLGDYACRKWAEAKPSRLGVVSRSLVTTAILDRVVSPSPLGGEDRGEGNSPSPLVGEGRGEGCRIEVINDLLVGLKYTGRLIEELQHDPEREFVFGGEEAHGYLSGTHCLDKDAANAACLMAAVVAEQKALGRTAYQHLLDLYRKHGVFANVSANLSLTLAEGGLARANRILERLRADPPRAVAGRPVLSIIDHHGPWRTTTNVATAAVVREPFDPGNVLTYVLSPDGLNRLTIRPSGTEPKMKLYGQWVVRVPADSPDSDVEGMLETTAAEGRAALASTVAQLRGM